MGLALSITLLVTANLYINPVLAISIPANPAKSSAIKSAMLQNDAFNPLLDSDFLYDFNNVTPTPFNPGSVIFADASSWPILSRGHSAISQINLGPCAMLAPHSHPRATKIAIAVTGSTRTFMRTENGGIDRTTLLTPGKMTIFPQGAMHAMVNQGCTPSILYSFFDSSDPGVLSFAQALMSVGPDIGLTVMPFITEVDGGNWNSTATKIPHVGQGAQAGYAACLRKCGISNSSSRTN